MKLIKQRFLRGPNLYSSRTCLLTIIDLEDLAGIPSNAVAGFTEALLTLMPTLEKHRCSPGRPGGFVERLRDGTYMAHIVEHVALELQCVAGTPAGFGRTRGVKVPRNALTALQRRRPPDTLATCSRCTFAILTTAI